ncbi:MAG TPA: c-type cytochrome [Chloroflexia bacterium]|nr:c-type cytochrome [Chloroflexia bacterium]
MPSKKEPGIFLLLAVFMTLFLTACSEDALTNPPVKPEVLNAFKAEPTTNQGDPTKGEKVFMRLPCLTCHELNGQGTEHNFGPELDHIGTTAATRLAGVNAAQYIRHALLSPQELSLPEFKPVMPGFGTTVSNQEINDLVAFLLNQK